MYELVENNFELEMMLCIELIGKLLILFYIAHGIAHLIGTFIYWRLMPATEDVPYKTTLFFSKIEVGEFGTSLLGLVYLIIALLFISSGIYLLVNKITFRENVILLIVGLSLFITFLDLMPAIVGFYINVFFIVVILINKKFKII